MHPVEIPLLIYSSKLSHSEIHTYMLHIQLRIALDLVQHSVNHSRKSIRIFELHRRKRLFDNNQYLMAIQDKENFCYPMSVCALVVGKANFQGRREVDAYRKSKSTSRLLTLFSNKLLCTVCTICKKKPCAIFLKV